MNDLLSALLGIESGSEMLGVDLRFAYAVPGWAVAILLIVIVVWCTKLYRSEAASLRPWLRWLLITLRSLAWATLLLLALRPVLHLDYLAEPRANLAILVDQSLSMGLMDESAPDAYHDGVATAVAGDAAGGNPEIGGGEVATLPRDEVVERALGNQRLDLLAQLAERYELQPFAFDVDLRKLERDEETGALQFGKLEGRVTQLGTALREVGSRLRGRPLAGIVVFTDGASNKGEDPVVAAEAMGSRGVPVYPVGVGAEDRLDLRVVRMEVPDWLFKDDEVAVRVVMASSGIDAGVADLRLAIGDGEVVERTVDIVPGTFHADIVIKPDQVGDIDLMAEIEPLPDEQLIENNRMTNRVRVIDSAIRILIAVDTPSWEYRYLKGFLDTDERIDTKVFIRRGDLRKARHNEGYLDRFPDIERLNRDFDCVILNNIGADYFSIEQMEGIRDYVTEGGGSMIVIASTHGTPSSFIDTPVEELFPVVVERIRDDPILDQADTFTQPYPLILTRSGRDHPLTRLDPVPDDNEAVWDALPDQYWYYPGIKRLRQGAVVLAEHGQDRNAAGPIPLIATQRSGRGQVMFMGFNSVWRWRYEIGNKYTNRFWGQAIQYLGLPHLIGNLNRVSYDIESFDWTAGEAIPLGVRVVDVDYRPIEEPDITLIALEQATGAEETFTLPSSPSEAGSYRGSMVLPEGTWTVGVEGYSGEGELQLRVHEPRYEFEQTALQRRDLEAVAGVSGGSYLPIAELYALPEAIAEGSTKVRRSIDRSLWNTWAALILATILLAAEWVTRKLVDLP